MSPEGKSVADLTAELEVLRSRLRDLEFINEEGKRTEEMLRENQRALFQFLEAVPVGVFVLDARGNPYYANMAARDLLGKDILPGTSTEKLAEVYRAYRAGMNQEYPAALQPIVRALSGETVMITDMEIRHPDRTLPLQVWGAPVYGRDGKLAYAIAAFSDISDRREAERRLQAQYQIARALAGSHTVDEAGAKILQPICETSGWDFGVLWIVDAAAGVLRRAGLWHASDPAVESFAQTAHQQTAAPGTGLLGRVWASGKPVWFADVVEEKDCPRAAVARQCGMHGALAFPIMAGNVIVGIMEFFSRNVRNPDDALTEMMVAYGNQISQFLERITADESLRKAKESAEQTAQSKAEILAVMSHEIRTPLNAVIGMTGLMMETDLTPSQSEYAETIRVSGETLLTVINDILDFSRIESTKLELEDHTFDLYACLEDVCDLVAHQAAAKDIDLVIHVAPDVPALIRADSTRLRQILTNLVSNAIKFTHQGDIQISVRVQARDDGGIGLRFEVRDTGIGIAPDKIDRLFKPYSQVEASTARRYGGTGLGLAICARLVELMGGAVSVESRLGEGSTFAFTIGAGTVAGTPADLLREKMPTLAGKSALVVDNNQANLNAIAALLGEWGMEVQATTEGTKALEWVEQGARFDVGVIDLLMPALAGDELAQKIRSFDSGRHLPVVLLTTLGKPPATGGSAGRETAATLTKPVKRSLLLQVLQTVLSSSLLHPHVGEAGHRLDPALASRIPLRILVAEDDPTSQKLMLMTLHHIGYLADAAASGVEVIDALKKKQYDLVFMDVEMPGMDGCETSRVIHREWKSEVCPTIVGITAHTSVEAFGRCREAGMEGCITKPIRVEEIQAAIERLGRQRGLIDEPTNSSLRPIIDAQRVLTILQIAAKHDPVAFGAMIETFLGEYREMLGAMKTAAENADSREIARAAHRLKGAAANLGVTRVQELCSLIERQAKNPGPGEYASLFRELDRSLEEVRAALEALKRSAPLGNPG